MNIWLKSILTGAVAAIAVNFISEASNNVIKVKKYKLECTIQAEPDTTAKAPFSISKIIGALEKRLEAADYKYEIKKTGEKNFTVSLSGLTDTLSPFSMLLSNGRVQFRELYRPGDISITPLLTAISNEMNNVRVSSEEEKTAPVKRDSVSKDVSVLIDSMESYKKKEKIIAAYKELIQFSQQYNDADGSIVYPSSIGALKLKDTTAVKTLFNQDKIKTKGPTDLQICFGEIDKTMNRKQQELIVSLYFIKTYGNEKALLENEDISDASAEFDQYGRAQVSLTFNQYGTRKWANLTQKNIGRPLAIILNNKVISAPNVLSAIPNGAASISGEYTYDECKLLSIGLKSNKLPANLHILSSTIKSDNFDYTQNRKLLIMMLSFVAAGCIAFFIFKTLKAT